MHYEIESYDWPFSPAARAPVWTVIGTPAKAGFTRYEAPELEAARDTIRSLRESRWSNPFRVVRVADDGSRQVEQEEG